MTEALHKDAGLLLDEDGITIRRSYLAMASSQRIVLLRGRVPTT